MERLHRLARQYYARTPNRETANKIQERIKQCDWFLFWQLPIRRPRDGARGSLVIPTAPKAKTGLSSFQPQIQPESLMGMQYMQLYRRIDYTLGSDRKVKRIEPGNSYSGTELSAI